MMPHFQKKVAFVLIALLYMAGLAGGFVPESDCTCGMEQASGGQLKCYCCAEEASDHCATLSFKSCHKSQKAKAIIETPALIEPSAQTARLGIPSASYIDTTAHPLKGFELLPERPPAV